MAEEITITDLFAGAGGLTKGLTSASTRFKPVQAVEWDLDAAASYKENFPEAEVFPGNIIDWVENGEIKPVDIVVGGPPCQGFSTLGKQKENDEKNFLWHQYADVVARANPKYFVMENVPQFRTSSQWGVFFEELNQGRLQNYTIQDIAILNAADFGTPQARKRMIVLGSRKDVTKLDYPVPTTKGSPVTVRQTFDGMKIPSTVTEVDLPKEFKDHFGRKRPGPFRSDQLHLTRRYTKLSMDRFEALKEGEGRFELPEHLKAPCWKKHTTGSADVMGRMHWDKPSVTIRTEFNKPEKGRYIHPIENRAITHFEAAVLMGFPPDYLWVGSKTSIARQIGNAVPIQLGKEIGRKIIEIL